MNIEPGLIHGSDAARSDFGKTGVLEEQAIVQSHQLMGRESLFRSDELQVLVSRGNARSVCRRGAGDDGRRVWASKLDLHFNLLTVEAVDGINGSPRTALGFR